MMGSKIRKIWTFPVLLLFFVASCARSCSGVSGEASEGENVTSSRKSESKAPFVVWSYKTGGATSAPAIGDVDRDGKVEVVVGSRDFKVYAFNGEDGSILWATNTGSQSNRIPALADLNNDGALDVVISNEAGNIFALNGKDGSKLWSFQAKVDKDIPPVLADVDGDGRVEVVFTSGDGYVYALNGENGTLLWKYKIWKKEIDRGVYPTLKVADINSDGKLEVVAPRGMNGIDVLNGGSGRLLKHYDVIMNTDSAPLIADVNGDKLPEILVDSPTDFCALDAVKGKKVWSYSVNFPTTGAVGDVNNDGQVDVIFNDLASIYAHAVDGGSGKLIWEWHPEGGYYIIPPVLGDVDGDGKLEVVIGGESYLYVINAEEGKLKGKFHKTKERFKYPFLGDVNGDGKIEIALGSSSGTVYILGTGKKMPHSKLLPWPAYMHDVKRTGIYTGGPNPPW